MNANLRFVLDKRERKVSEVSLFLDGKRLSALSTESDTFVVATQGWTKGNHVLLTHITDDLGLKMIQRFVIQLKKDSYEFITAIADSGGMGRITWSGVSTEKFVLSVGAHADSLEDVTENRRFLQIVDTVREWHYRLALKDTANGMEYEYTGVVKFSIPTCNGEGSTYMYDRRDGELYKCMSIGAQQWMVEDLRIGADTNIYNSKDGRYSWESAVRTGCPLGWRLPTQDDWKKATNTLESELGDLYSEMVGMVFVNLGAMSGWTGEEVSGDTARAWFGGIPFQGRSDEYRQEELKSELNPIRCVRD